MKIYSIIPYGFIIQPTNYAAAPIRTLGHSLLSSAVRERRRVETPAEAETDSNKKN